MGCRLAKSHASAYNSHARADEYIEVENREINQFELCYAMFYAKTPKYDKCSNHIFLINQKTY